MAVVFIRAIILYLLLIFSVRFMGKHQIGELQPSELAVTILISNIATLPVENTTTPLLTGIVPILTLVCLDVLMSWFGIKSRRLRNLTCGKPVVVISNGEFDRQKMRELRFTVDDLAEALRSQGIFDINEVQYAVVETTGTVSIMKKHDFDSVTNSDMKIKGKNLNPPEIIVDEGCFNEEAAKRIGVNRSDLSQILVREKSDISEVFILSMDIEKNYTLIKRGSGKESK